VKRPKLGKFSLVSLRDLLAASLPTILLVLAACAVAYVVVDPAPPRHVTLATGQENSAYEEFGRKYAALLARDGIKVELQRSLGSEDNLQRLIDGKADIAFVQSGSTSEARPSSASWCRWAACSPSRCGCSCAKAGRAASSTSTA
jgi:ABC-type nitrate/sulfonate/bicarbonate transport system substrate-binding protein